MVRTAAYTTLFFLLPLLFLLLSCGDGDHQLENQTSENGRTLDYTGEVVFINSTGDSLSTIDVAVADDNRSRSEGLMNVTNLPEGSGMLFIFPEEQQRSFWMANTPLPLDILFVDEEMNIVRIHRNTRPYSQESIQSEEPAKFVVEVNAGYTVEHDIREGMKIAIHGVDW